MSMGHWPVIIGAAVAAWLIGALWYSPVLFANAWVKAHGFTPDQLEAMKKNAAKAYGGSFVAFILMAFVLHLFLAHMGVSGAVPGVMWAFHAWLGFAMPVTLIACLYGNKSMAAFVIDTGYQLVYLLAMGAILGQLM